MRRHVAAEIQSFCRRSCQGDWVMPSVDPLTSSPHDFASVEGKEDTSGPPRGDNGVPYGMCLRGIPRPCSGLSCSGGSCTDMFCKRRRYVPRRWSFWERTSCPIWSMLHVLLSFSQYFQHRRKKCLLVHITPVLL